MRRPLRFAAWFFAGLPICGGLFHVGVDAYARLLLGTLRLFAPKLAYAKSGDFFAVDWPTALWTLHLGQFDFEVLCGYLPLFCALLLALERPFLRRLWLIACSIPALFGMDLARTAIVLLDSYQKALALAAPPGPAGLAWDGIAIAASFNEHFGMVLIPFLLFVAFSPPTTPPSGFPLEKE